eukprot:7948331-Pyramimonas_sp.AAC.1
MAAAWSLAAADSLTAAWPGKTYVAPCSMATVISGNADHLLASMSNRTGLSSRLRQKLPWGPIAS